MWFYELPIPPLTSCQSMPRPPNSVAIMMLAYEMVTLQSRKKKGGFKPSPHITFFERRSTMNHFINKPCKKNDLGENRVKPTKAPGSLDRNNNTLDIVRRRNTYLSSGTASTFMQKKWCGFQEKQWFEDISD